MNNKLYFIANDKVVPPDIFTMEQLRYMDQYFAAKHIDKVNRSIKFYSDNNLLGDYKYKHVHVYSNGGMYNVSSHLTSFNASL